MPHSTRLWSQIYFAIRAGRAASLPPSAADAPTILVPSDGEIVCGSGEVIRLQRRECELLQILHAKFGHFMPWQEIARKLFAITDETRDEAAIIRTFAHTIRAKIDGKCSFGIEGRQGYGYRVFGRMEIDR